LVDISLKTKLLIPEEVADYLRISIHQVNRLCRSGKLKHIKVGQRTFRFTEKHIIDFLEQAIENKRTK